MFKSGTGITIFIIVKSFSMLLKKTTKRDKSEAQA